MDQCWTPIGHFRLIFLYNYLFYSRYKTVWIANTEIGLDPNNSVIKRLWCIFNIAQNRVNSKSLTFIDLLYSYFQHLLFRTIGTCLVIADPPEDQKLAVLNEVWKSLVKLKNPGVINEPRHSKTCLWVSDQV